jgi:hypothetical protein
MSQLKTTDGMLQEWGTRLFHGMPKKTKRVPVGPTFMSAAYISRQGKPEVGGPGKTLELEDELGAKISGAKAIKDLEYDWQMAGGYIPDSSHRREVFNIMLSMPAGTPPDKVLDSARAFAKETFEGHKYVFVLHNDTKSPHVHLAVRAERMDGLRLNPRKADLQEWRERFAARLQDRGISAVATRASTRNVKHAPKPIWQAHEDGRGGRPSRRAVRSPESVAAAKDRAVEAWGHLQQALAASTSPEDRELSQEVSRYVQRHFVGQEPRRGPAPKPSQDGPSRSRG